jgi:hypothetical protein
VRSNSTLAFDSSSSVNNGGKFGSVNFPWLSERRVRTSPLVVRQEHPTEGQVGDLLARHPSSVESTELEGFRFGIRLAVSRCPALTTGSSTPTMSPGTMLRSGRGPSDGKTYISSRRSPLTRVRIHDAGARRVPRSCDGLEGHARHERRPSPFVRRVEPLGDEAGLLGTRSPSVRDPHRWPLTELHRARALRHWRAIAIYSHVLSGEGAAAVTR